MSYKDLEAQDYSSTFNKDKPDCVLLDVRSYEEFNEGHIPGAIHIPYDEIEERLGEIDYLKKKAVLSICRSGVRSLIAINILLENGFSNLTNLKGGMKEWSGPVNAPSKG